MDVRERPGEREPGHAVAGAGDVNGDGFADVIVGAWVYDNGAAIDDKGRVWVFHGSATGLSTSANWVVDGDAQYAGIGESVASAGDVNGDGYADVIIGAYGYLNEEVRGRASVYYGSGSGLGSTAAWTVDGDQADADFGFSVASAGDVNGDGYSDVVVGATYYDNGSTNEGRAYVYHGLARGPSCGAGCPFSNLSTVADWSSWGWSHDSEFAWSVASAGDVNGDGYGDVIVGAPLHDTTTK